MANTEKVRLNKYLSQAGICSRREADVLIEGGKVSVNGKIADPGMRVNDLDKITVEDKPVGHREKKVVLAYYKPVGVTCTEKDKHAQITIRDVVEYPVRVTYAGRLDRDSEGLLLLTNDGDLINGLMRAANFHEKEYLVRVNKPISRDFLKKMSAKMSKSLGNCIYLSDTEADVKKKVMSMFTDPNHLRVEDPGNVDGNPVFIYLDAFCRPEHFAEFLPDYQNLDELKAHYQRGGLGDVKVKKFLNNVMQSELAPIRERRKYWEEHLTDVYDILKKGSEVAEAKAAETLKDVKAAMKINYFEDSSLLKGE